jgi:phosphoribosyl-ATP pyrophosphohydrolase
MESKDNEMKILKKLIEESKEVRICLILIDRQMFECRSIQENGRGV